MTITAGTLQIEMMANVARLAQDMTTAKDVVGSAMADVSRSVSMAKDVLASLGVGLGVGYFVSLIEGSINAQAHLDDLTKSTSLTVAQLSGLKLLAAESGTDLDSISKAVDRMSVAMGKSPEKFVALGVTAKDNTGAFKQLADIFDSLTDVQQRNALAQAVFSKSWAEVAPALSMGSKAIGEILDKGAALSGVTAESAAQANKLKAEVAELNTTLDATKNKLVSDSVPAMGEITKAMQAAAEQGGLLLTVWVAMGSFWPTLGGLLSTLFGGGKTSVNQMGDDILSLQANLDTLITKRNLVAQHGPTDGWDIQIAKTQAQIDALRLAIRATNGEFQDQVSRSQQHSTATGAPLDAAGTAAAAAAFLATTKDQKNAYDSLIKSIDEKIVAGQDELDATVKLTAAQQFIAKTIAVMDDSTHKLTQTQRDNVLGGLDLVASIDAEARSRAAATAAASGYYDILAQLDTVEQAKIDRARALVESMDEQNAKTTLENSLIGASTIAMSLANIEREREIALRGVDDQVTIDNINRRYDSAKALAVEGDAARAQLSIWTDLSASAGKFFGDLIVNGKSAFDRLRTELKQFLADLISIFAQKWILQIAAGAAGAGSAGTALGNAAGAVGQNTATGAISGVAGSFIGAGLDTVGTGLYAAGAQSLGASVATLGQAMYGGVASVGGFSEALAAAIPVIGWVVAIGLVLYAIFGTGAGGAPKSGGSFGGTFDAAGKLIGSASTTLGGNSSGRLYTPSDQDPAMATLGKSIASGIVSTLGQLGTKWSGGSAFIGFDSDTGGSAGNRISSGLTDASGKVIFSDVNRAIGNDSTTITPELQLEASRMLLAAIQSSDLPSYLSKVFDGLTPSTATQQQITDAVNTGLALKGIFDLVSRNPMADVATALTASLNPLDTALKNNDAAIHSVMTAYDGTLTTTQNLATATVAYYNAQLQLIAGIQQAKQAIDDMFGTTFQNIKLAGLDTQGKYNFYQSDAQAAEAQALTSTDPATIQRLATRINDDINAAFGLLTPDQQRAQGPAFIAAGTTAQSALDARLEKIQTDAAAATQATLDEIKNLIGAGAASQTAAANTQVAAANTNLAAAQTPRTFTFNFPAYGQQVTTFSPG